MIIGLVGMPKSGKGEAVKALESEGWTAISMSGLLREQILSHNPQANIKRNTLFNASIRLRKKYGDGYLATLCLEKIRELPPEKRKKVVIDGIRRPEEIKTVVDAYKTDAYFLGIIADEDRETDADIRFKRLKLAPHERGTGFESALRHGFDIAQEKEWDNPEPHGNKIGKCLDTVAEMQVTGHGKIMVNSGTQPEDKEKWQEEVWEYAKSLEGVSRHPEVGF